MPVKGKKALSDHFQGSLEGKMIFSVKFRDSAVFHYVLLLTLQIVPKKNHFKRIKFIEKHIFVLV